MTEGVADVDFRFDNRVAVQYDALRGHPDHVSREIGEALSALIGAGGLVLEPGVGTGRIALPLTNAGCSVVGVDMSAEMLSALSGRAVENLSLLRGDITKLPFASDAFDAALCVHVLHLVDSESVLKRLTEIVRPGGLIILARDWIDPASFAGQMRNAFRQAVVDLAETIDFPMGARGFVSQLMELGAEAVHDGQEQVMAEWTTSLSPQNVLDGIASRDDAESWVLPDPLLAKVMERLEQFVAERWSDPSEMQNVTRRFVYSLFRAP